MNTTFNYNRRHTLSVNVGQIPMGSEWPIRVQSMTNTATDDVEASPMRGPSMCDSRPKA